ncbi:MAG: hypothetical protein LBU26_01875 [Synergistaceae bacterium]|jgi:hypothetical protein|nr:hypothetical protein [Synergistaceae bacterium]
MPTDNSTCKIYALPQIPPSQTALVKPNEAKERYINDTRKKHQKNGYTILLCKYTNNLDDVKNGFFGNKWHKDEPVYFLKRPESKLMTV